MRAIWHKVRRKPGRYGFTLAEVLITIAVISIGFLGTMAALAFGMTASRDTAQHTLALNYNRRILELLFSKVIPTTQLTNTDPADPGVNFPDATAEEAVWRRLYYRPTFTLPSGLSDWFALSDWYPGSTTTGPEAKKFVVDSERYRVNVTYRRDIVGGSEVSANTDPKYNLLHIVIQTRWRERAGKTDGAGLSKFRAVRTEATMAER